MLIYLAGEGRVVTIDHLEAAPAAFNASLLYEDGAPIERSELVSSGLGVGTPGTVRGWDEALRSHGTMTLDRVLRRAISVAESGFDGASPDLARTYGMLAQGGADAFYKGAIAQAIVSAVTGGTAARPGVMSLDDLAGYQAIVREPVASEYRGHTVHGADVPSSGGLTVAMILNLLSGYDPGAFDRADFLHRTLESSRLAFADRGAYMADPAFADVPREGLLSEGYADERRLLILPFAATAPAEPGDPWAHQAGPGSGQAAEGSAALDEPGREAAHITVADADGNIVSYTCSSASEGGNGIAVPGHGFLLNSALADFDIPGDPMTPQANAAEPGKRPRSSVAPLILARDGRPVLALGSSGGSAAITTAAQILVNHLDLDMPIDEAVAAPRVAQRGEGDLSSVAEAAFLDTEDAAALEELGHVLVESSAPLGAATGIRFHEDGSVTVVAEPTRRNGGHAMVVTPE
jgi:gamma-glutamyltranspeptidase/glutathione hydrolase